MSINIDERGNVLIGDAKIFAKNFSGNKFGKGGSKGFCVFIDEEWATRLAQDGWNVKVSEPNEFNDEARYFVPVAVNYNEYYEPNIYTYTAHNRIRLTENSVKELDSAIIEKVDLIIHPRVFEDKFTHERKVKAYAKTMHVTLEADPFADSYINYIDHDSETVPF